MSQKDLYDIIVCIKMVSTWATILYIAHIKKKKCTVMIMSTSEKKENETSKATERL